MSAPSDSPPSLTSDLRVRPDRAEAPRVFRDAADVAAAQTGVSLSDYLSGGIPRSIAAAPVTSPRGPALGLDGGQRQQVVDGLSRVIGGVYAHLPLKRAGYASDPVQALTLLRRRCVEMSDAEFHLAMTGIVTGLRDAHTRYRGPSSGGGRVAVLPFLVEAYGGEDDPTYLVSKVGGHSAVEDPDFAEGVVLEWWNGVPMARAVEIYADRETGGRPDARRARAVESLTFRALDFGPPPDEHWVDVGFRTPGGTVKEVRIPWRVVDPALAAPPTSTVSPQSLRIAADPARQAIREARTLLFAGEVWRESRPSTDIAGGTRPFDDVVTARAVATRRGDLGYLRLWSFDVTDDDAYLAHVTELLHGLPSAGLIVDLRGNPGGLVWAAERLLQLFTDRRPILPTRFSLLATPLTREMAASPFNRLELGLWAASLESAVATGEVYSRPLPLTDPAWCNDQAWHYPGPVVAVVDPNTYSAGDLFAAGWVDHEIGPLVAVGSASGGGGANVWTDRQIADALAPTASPLGALPGRTGFTLSFRRAIRSADGEGIPIEDAGISGIPYAMTLDDLRFGNRDLLEFCADQLGIA